MPESRELNPVNSIKFSHFLTYGEETIDMLTSTLYEELLTTENRTRQRGDKDAASLYYNLKLLVINLYCAYSINPSISLSIRCGNGDYKSESRYLNTKVSKVMLVDTSLEFLVSQGYINKEAGVHTKHLTLLRATQQLISLFENYSLNPKALKENLDRELIYLKDNKKQLLDYEDTEEIELIRENLRKINLHLFNQDIGLLITDNELAGVATSINFTNKTLTRIFNNSSFEQGGRFYHGWWQGVPSKYRKYITINNQFCAEIDYSSMQIATLYSLIGLEKPDGDGYDLSGLNGLPETTEELRKVYKKIFSRMMNVPKAGLKLGRDTEKDLIDHHQKELDILSSFDKEIKDIEIAFQLKHPQVQHLFFNKERGLELLFRDSQIAEQIMLTLTKEGITVLPIHDSFLVPMEDRAKLREVMKESFEAISGVRAPDKDLDIIECFEESKLLEHFNNNPQLYTNYRNWQQS